MKKISLSLAILFLLVRTFVLRSAEAAETARWRGVPLGTLGGRIERIIEKDGEGLFLLSEKGLSFISLKEKRSSSSVPVLLRDPVTDLLFEKGAVWAATEEGIRISSDGGRSWKEGIPLKDVQALLKQGDRLLAGTGDGLRLVDPRSLQVKRVSGDIGRGPIRMLRSHPQGAVAVGRNKVYLLEPDSWASRVIFEAPFDEEEEVLLDESDEASPQMPIRALEIFGDTIYLATDNGFYKSAPGLNGWRHYPSDGIPISDIRSLALIPSDNADPIPCLGGAPGVFCHIDGEWLSEREGLSGSVQTLLVTSHGDLLAAGESLFRLQGANKTVLSSLAGRSVPALCEFRAYARYQDEFSNEPSISEAQAMAIRYADMDRSKIEAWKRQARLKALLPDISVGVDRVNTERYHWDTGASPDNLLKGEHYHDWDVSVSWDLADLVFSSDQTAIDSRSKLMVELREDILDQVTRLFFERRRLQIEGLACQYPNEGEQMAVAMRVDELTALIDAYTGGDFSRRIRNVSKTNKGG
ncbi:MAG: hypothetical protein GX606_02800 [Elusimicrobia bacterium]|nr:hypothetical protein [Elusimicrobiota bacterium]